MLNKNIKVLKNSFCDLLEGCHGRIKAVEKHNNQEYYLVQLDANYYGKVYLKDNEFQLI
ncbi:hypothetical protein [Halalkalibacter oceani]|uniref:hypothetical protein n=1 Tax=Halalkalibacter oceani TaxID=1653776 RepID=UPI00339A0B2A